MKIIDIVDKDKIEIVDQQQVAKKVQFIGRIMPQSGHKTFEYNTITNELVFATIEPTGETSYHMKVLVVHKRINNKPDCLYFTALNFKNAEKYLQKKVGLRIKPIVIK
mgnify:CR=1 FL=1